MKRILFFLLLLPTLGLAQLELPFPVKVVNPKPLDFWYFESDGTPYDNTTEVTTQVLSAIRYIGQTFNVNGVEYWFGVGITDPDLVVKLQSPLTFSNGLTESGGSVTASGDAPYINFYNTTGADSYNFELTPTYLNNEIINASLSSKIYQTKNEVTIEGVSGANRYAINVNGANGISFDFPTNATGDTYHRGASSYYDRLPIGSLGDVYTVGASGVPEWAAPSGGGWPLGGTGVLTGSVVIEGDGSGAQDVTIGGVATEIGNFNVGMLGNFNIGSISDFIQSIGTGFLHVSSDQVRNGNNVVYTDFDGNTGQLQHSGSGSNPGLSFPKGTFYNTSNQLTLGTTRTVTITAPTPATASRTWTIPDLSGDMTFASVTGSQALTNKSVNGVTLTAAGSSSNYLREDGTYGAPSGTAHTLDSHSNVTITANSSGELLKWNGSAWINNTLAEAGIQPAGSYLTSEVDGSISNELQTITNSSDATSHTVTLSSSGGTVQLIEGANITLTTGGTGSAGTVTIASTGGGSSAFDDLTAAAATNSIDNTNYLQTWNWSTLASTYGLSLLSNSTTASGDAQGLLSVQLTGANSNAGQISVAGRFINNHTGTGSENYALALNASSGDTNYALWVDEGNIKLDAGVNFELDATTGTKFGTATTQKIGFYNATPVVRQNAVTTVQELADALTAYGLLPSSTVSGGSGLTYAQVKAMKFK